MKRLLTSVLFLIPMAMAFAQDLNPPKEITDLGWMVGTWTGSGNMSFGTTQTPFTSTLTFSFEGQFLKEVSTDKSDQYTLTKSTMIGWDPDKKEYVSYTFTNMAPTARIAHGKMDDGKLVFTAEPWQAEGFTAVMRETLSKTADSKLGSKIEMKDGDKWDTSVDITLSKQ